MLDDTVVESVRVLYQSLLESGDLIETLGKTSSKPGSRSPLNSLTRMNGPVMSNMNGSGHAYKQYNQGPYDPRLPLGVSNQAYSPVHPVMQLQAPPASHSPRDPRVFHQNQAFAYATAPLPYPGYAMAPSYAYGTMSPEHVQYLHGGMPALPPPPPYAMPQEARRIKPSRSQPARSRRYSYSDASSDSDDAEAISRRIMTSSDDPRELKRIIKDARNIRRHKSANSPKVSVRENRRIRDDSLPSYLDLISESMEKRSSNSERRRRSKSEHGSRKSNKAKLSRSVTPPVPQQTYEEEIPAAREQDWLHQFEEREQEFPVEKIKGRKKESKSHERRKLKVVTTETNALVPVYTDEEVGVQPPRRKEAKNRSQRTSQKDLIGEKVQTWWDPVVTGKRQRLPVLDWRKGERYNRAPDGTIIGKEGFSNLVFDDTGKSSKKREKPSHTTTTDEGVVVYSKKKRSSDVKKSSRRSSVSSAGGRRSRRSSTSSQNNTFVQDDDARSALPIPDSVMPDEPGQETEASAPRPLLNAFDYLQKDADGIYCLGKFRILHRRLDRKWGPKDMESGFRLCPSIATDDAFIAEIALDPGKSSAKEAETLAPGQAIYGRVLKAAPNSIRLQVNGEDVERLGEDDEFYIDEGSTYFITNLSQAKAAVLSLTAFS